MQEAKLLSQLDSPYIVRYHDSFVQHKKINIVMELCENGDLGLYLKR